MSYLFDLDKFVLTTGDDDASDSEDELGFGATKPSLSTDDGDDDDGKPIYTVDGRACGGVTRFINHSCDPNLETYVVITDRKDEQVFNLGLFTRRDVAAWEELSFSYVTEKRHAITSVVKEDRERDGAGWPCHCGAQNCSKFLW